MTAPLFAGKNVLVLGLGILGGGVGAARFLAQEGAHVLVSDLRSEVELSSSVNELRALDAAIEFSFGPQEVRLLDGIDVILRNPAVPREAEILKEAAKCKIPVEMDASLFVKLLGHTNIIGVTGTRGKTTTATLIAEIGRRAKRHVVFGGNIPGGSMLSLFHSVTPRSIIVLELSSWQLEGFGEAKLSPSIAVITNIFPDHLNRYPSMDAYVESKKVIYRYQSHDDHLFLNSHDPWSQEFLAEAKGSVIQFSPDDLPDHGWSLMIPGIHNRANAAAAKAVSQHLYIDDETIRQAIESFPGVPHRLEVVRTLGGVTYVNDSASTMPEATMAALAAFSSPIVLICGGNDKGLAFDELGNLINRRVKSLVFLEGNGTEKLASVVEKNRIVSRTMSLSSALQAARRTAVPGDIILFSPAFTSFGMFKNEFDRGEKFKNMVMELK
ncbi:MAG: UDP-N-acetylmuramoyl-L-alanine--D-glutamate ligase [bacterium]|nr:UDP-N-acetylmuramoyl-L-alanine--D-glutamate ligase [bacterium]